MSVLEDLDPVELGGRLQEARKAAAITQQQAADSLGMARTTVTAIEKGERRIRSGELLKLSELYGRSVHELLRRTENVQPMIVRLRAAVASDTSLEQAPPPVQELQELCADYLELERLCDAPLTQRYAAAYVVDHLPPEVAGEDVAQRERHRLGLGDGPVLDLRVLLENDVGLRVFFLPMQSRIGAMFSWSEEFGGCVAVNDQHSEERQRWSMAHEYGHFLTDRVQAEVLLPEQSWRRRPRSERFADAFARAFLMPASGLRRRYNEIRESRRGKATPADLCRLAHQFHVSFEAVMRRLEELGDLRAGTYDNLIEQGFKVTEARRILGLTTASSHATQRLPERYQYLAVEAFLSEQLSEGELARFLRVGRIDARRIVQQIEPAGDVDFGCSIAR